MELAFGCEYEHRSLVVPIRPPMFMNGRFDGDVMKLVRFVGSMRAVGTSPSKALTPNEHNAWVFQATNFDCRVRLFAPGPAVCGRRAAAGVMVNTHYRHHLPCSSSDQSPCTLVFLAHLHQPLVSPCELAGSVHINFTSRRAAPRRNGACALCINTECTAVHIRICITAVRAIIRAI